MRNLLIMLALLATAATASGEPRRLTLDEARDMAFRQRAVVGAARARVSAAAEDAGVAFAGYLPSVAVDAGYSRMTANYGGQPGQVPQTPGQSTNSTASYDYFNFGLTVSQPIWDFGRTLGANDRAERGVDVARRDEGSARADLWFRVVAGYYQVLASQQLVEAATRARDLARAMADRAASLYKAGTRPRVDLLQSEATAQAAEAGRMSAAEALAANSAAFLASLGAAEPFEFVAARPEASGVRDVPARAAALDEAFAARPERAAVAARVKVAEAEVRVLNGDWWPRLFAAGRFSESGTQFLHMAWNWQVGVGLTWPVFSGLATRHGVRAAEARVAFAKAALEEIDVTVRSDLDQALARLAGAVGRAEPLRLAQAAASEALAVADQRYKAGEGSQVEVREAQTALAQAEAAVVRAALDADLAWAGLDRALGRVPAKYGAAAP